MTIRPILQIVRFGQFSLVACWLVLGTAPIAQAQNRDFFYDMSKEQASIFDVGMKGLRQLTLAAASRMSDVFGEVPKIRVKFKPAGPDNASGIDITFLFGFYGVEQNDFHKLSCKERLDKIIAAVLRTNTINYAGQLTQTGRVARRLGNLFSRETSAIDIIDLRGQIVAENTTITLGVSDQKNQFQKLCQTTADQ